MKEHIKPALAADGRQRWSTPLLRRLFRTFPSDRRPWRHAILAFLKNDSGLQRAWERRPLHCSRLPSQAVFWPAPGVPADRIPALTNVTELVNWIGAESPQQLSWYADRWQQHHCRQAPHLQPYQCLITAKRNGSPRIIEAPCATLKNWQRRLARNLLQHIPIHAQAQAYTKGRDHLSNAAIHGNKASVLKLDLCDFFPSITGRRVAHLFHSLGFPDPLAGLLAGLCTTRLPAHHWSALGLDPRHHWQQHLRYSQSHLPQGAPTSPVLANLICFRLDCRLAGLAQKYQLAYSRYADDIAFSGAAAAPWAWLKTATAAICEAEGFQVNYRKLSCTGQSGQQHITGLVVNAGANLSRHRFDRIKAEIHQHVWQPVQPDIAPALQARLKGLIAYVRRLRPHKADRLQKLYQRIAWP